MGGGEVKFWESYETHKYPQWEESTVCIGTLGGAYGYKYALTAQITTIGHSIRFSLFFTYLMCLGLHCIID
jgi:hypothetical protein